MHIEQAISEYTKQANDPTRNYSVRLFWQMVDLHNDLVAHQSDLIRAQRVWLGTLDKALRKRLVYLAGTSRFGYHKCFPGDAEERTGRQSYTEGDELREIEIALSGRYLALRDGEQGAAEELAELASAYQMRYDRLLMFGMTEEETAEFAVLKGLLRIETVVLRREILSGIAEDEGEPVAVSAAPLKAGYWTKISAQNGKAKQGSAPRATPRKKNSVSSDQGTLFVEDFSKPQKDAIYV